MIFFIDAEETLDEIQFSLMIWYESPQSENSRGLSFS